MQVIRTIAWILLVCGIMLFSFYNWRPVEITIWENLVLETKVPVVLVLAFLGGFAPLLTYHLSVSWGMKRRIRNLENSLKMLSTPRRSESASDGGMVPITAAGPDGRKAGLDEHSFGDGDTGNDAGGAD